MLTLEEYDEMTLRLQKGKEWIEKLPGGWGGRPTAPWFSPSRDIPKTKHERMIVLWRKLAEQHFQAAIHLGILKAPDTQKHTVAWNNMKFNEALEKWKHTVKSKRGPDPRTIPRENFI